MTNDGFCGNARYLIMPAALVCVLAGDGHRLADPGAARARWFGGGVAVAVAVRRGRRRLRRAERRPPRRRPDGDRLPGARSPTSSPAPSRAPAGRIACKACGDAYTGAFQVPVGRLDLRRAHDDVQSASAPGDAPPRCPPSSCGRSTTAGSRSRSRASRASAARPACSTLAISRRLAHRGPCCGMSAAASDRRAPAARASRALGTARLRRQRCPVAARSSPSSSGSRWRCARRRIHARFWIDEGLSVGIASHPLVDIPGVLRQDGSPPLYYLLLNALDERLRRRRGRHARAVGRLRAARRCPAAWLGGARALRRARRLDRGAAGRAQPVPDLLRAGDADVRARRPALDGRDGDVRRSPSSSGRRALAAGLRRSRWR